MNRLRIAISYPLGFLCIPLCVWAGFRFGMREAATATCLLSTIAIWGSIHGLGTFARQSPNDALLLLQAFMAVTAVIGMSVGAAVSERRLAEDRLRRFNRDLEDRVRARTTELQSVLDRLVSSEGRLAEAQQVAHVGSWEWKVPENRVWWSEELHRIYGVDRDSFRASYEAFLEAVHSDDREMVSGIVRRAFEDRQPFEFEHRIIRPDGEERTVSAKGHVVQDDLGQVIRMLGTAQDITERKRLEEQLQQAQKMEAVGRLAGGVAHDFNNMLTVILGFSEMMLLQIGDDKPISGDLQEIRKAAEATAALTQQLLAFSRKQVLRMVAVDLNTVVSTVEQMLRRTLGEDIRIVVNLSTELRLIQADMTQVQQVLMNLALNARDAMPGGGTLAIETANVDLTSAYASTHSGVLPGRYVRLAVSDTGQGMDALTKTRVFEPFFTTKEHGRGTGLGLATVYGIVQQLGGTIWVYSQLGYGTTFKLYFPEARASVGAFPAAGTRPLNLVGAEIVLLVEDDERVREFAARVLRRYGYHVHEADSPTQALALADRVDGPIHLLLTDMIMPGMNGLELVRRFSAKRPQTRVLYMSGYTGQAMQQHGLSIDADELLEKPFTPNNLLWKIREVLDAKTVGRFSGCSTPRR